MPEKKTVTNIRTGEDVVELVATPEEAYLAALHRELDMCKRRNLPSRVKGIEAEIKRVTKALEEQPKAPEVTDESGEDEEHEAPAEQPAVTATAAPNEKRGPVRPRKYAKGE